MDKKQDTFVDQFRILQNSQNVLEGNEADHVAETVSLHTVRDILPRMREVDYQKSPENSITTDHNLRQHSSSDIEESPMVNKTKKDGKKEKMPEIKRQEEIDEAISQLNYLEVDVKRTSL